MTRRRLVFSILAGTLAASASGCGINGQVVRTEAPKVADDGDAEDRKPKRVTFPESPAVLRWAGGDN